MNRSRTARRHPVLSSARLSHELVGVPRRIREREFVKIADELWLPATAVRDLETLSVAYSRLYPSGVLTGWSAAVLHGVRPEDGAVPELWVGAQGRARRGLRVRRYDLPESEIRVISGVRVTSALWTAFDLTRFNEYLCGVIALEKLYKWGLSELAMERALRDLAGFWGVDRARRAFAAADSRSESPRETETRVLLMENGFTDFVPQVNIPELGYRLDLADTRLMIAIEYDGVHHDNSEQQSRDRIRRNRLQAAGWIVIEVDRRSIRGQREEILEQVRAAYRLRQAA